MCPHTGLEPQTREVKVNGSGSLSHQVSKNNSIIYFQSNSNIIMQV